MPHSWPFVPFPFHFTFFELHLVGSVLYAKASQALHYFSLMLCCITELQLAGVHHVVAPFHSQLTADGGGSCVQLWCDLGWQRKKTFQNCSQSVSLNDHLSFWALYDVCVEGN